MRDHQSPQTFFLVISVKTTKILLEICKQTTSTRLPDWKRKRHFLDSQIQVHYQLQTFFPECENYKDFIEELQTNNMHGLPDWKKEPRLLFNTTNAQCYVRHSLSFANRFSSSAFVCLRVGAHHLARPCLLFLG